ncbi:LolA family protein [Halostella litorea]|uniref:LolA family protein n=1 Tax=Halostella litorea TaxID=2528831 RepID=UPI001092F6FC|nr:outer membrane lipoprotein carrier protein LolA [Halostella litorea]
MPLIESPLQRAAVGVLAVFLVSAGMFAAFGGDTGASEPEPIGENASAAYAGIDGVSATVVSEVEGPNTSSRTEMVVKERPGTQYVYQRTLEGSANGTEIYSNGSVMWIYDRGAGTATRQTLPDNAGNTTTTGERLDDIFARINEQRGVADGDGGERGVSPLPVVASPATSTGPVERPPSNATDYDVTYLGTDAVDGRETHVVRINGTLSGGNVSTSSMTNVSQTVWIDAKRFYPLKYHQSFTLNGDPYEVRMTYENVTFDPGFDDSAFEFDPPENVTVERQTLPETTTYDSRGALAAAAEMRVPDPDPPAGFSADGYRRTVGEYRSVSLEYTNGTGEISVTKTNRTPGSHADDAERVEVDGRTVWYSEFGATRTVSWECGGHRYSVFGQDVDRSDVLDVAATVDCGGDGQPRSDSE